MGVVDINEVMDRWAGPVGKPIYSNQTAEELEAIRQSSWGDTSKWFSSADGRIAAETLGNDVGSNGERYANTYVWVVSFRDNKISEVREYIDTAYLFKKFGIEVPIGDAAMRPDTTVRFSIKDGRVK